MKTPTVLTVTQLNTYIKSVIDGDVRLQTVFVSGELSNFTNHYRTGHWYMSLKDGASAIKAVMFRTANQRLRFTPEDGMRVLVRGRVSVYERDGQYQLYVDDMQPEGAGALAVAFEQLKAKLAARGLLDPARKKPIPEMPARVGVVTSDTGAAIHDIINILSRRFPMTTLVLAPVQVQGAQAAAQIADAIRRFNQLDGADVLIVGRGGGSAEDLWAFNEEVVAMAIAESEIPVISAVGHETDVTISDFVADLRAPTPSAAAELAVPDWREQAVLVNALYAQCRETLLYRCADGQETLAHLSQRLRYLNPAAVIETQMQTLDNVSQRVLERMQYLIEQKSGALASAAARLAALNPMQVMARGYAIVYKEKKPLTSAAQVRQGDAIEIRLADGTFSATAD